MPIVEKQLSSTLEQSVSIHMADAVFKCDLVIPEDPSGLVLFAAENGMSRSSSKGRRVVNEFEEQGLATLMFDLLTPEEAAVPNAVWQRKDVPLIAARLVDVATWASEQRELRPLPFGYFGNGVAAAAALVASTQQGGEVAAIVSRGGRVDLASAVLAHVRPPTLLLAADGDAQMAQRNESALLRLGAKRKEMILIPGSLRQFEDTHELEIAAELAADWFARYLILPS